MLSFLGKGKNKFSPAIFAIQRIYQLDMIFETGGSSGKQVLPGVAIISEF